MRRVHASHVSRVLASAGCDRGRVEPSSRGNANYYTPGFVVKGSRQAWETGLVDDHERDAGCVTVERMELNSHGATAGPGQDVAAYAAVLRDAGFQVETRTRSTGRQHLVLRGRSS